MSNDPLRVDRLLFNKLFNLTCMGLVRHFCFLCEAPLAAGASQAFSRIVCRTCHEALPGSKARRCQTCALTTGQCQCVPTGDWQTAAVSYSGLSARWVSRFKNTGNTQMARHMAELTSVPIYAAMDERWPINNALILTPLVIPIPSSRERLRERGHNPAQIFASHLCRALKRRHGVRCELLKDLLLRPSNQTHQLALSKAARETNLKDAFQINLSRFKSLATQRSVILVDDVMTTGATLNNAKAVLKNAGFSSVHCAVFARTELPGFLAST
jgi:ComF family protein